MLDKDDKFCIAPWIHLYTDPNGKVQPCCTWDSWDATKSGYDQNLLSNSLEGIWNSAEHKNLRLQFLEGKEFPVGCRACKNKEAAGVGSYRTRLNELFEHHIDHARANTGPDGHYDKFKLYMWDFRFSNICNFKCRMCGPELSSAWYDDRPTDNPDWTEKNKWSETKFLDSSYHGTDLMKYVEDNIDVVEEIYFAGGEPLLMPEHYKIIDRLLELGRTDVRLRYNTNLSTLKYKNYDMIDIWSKFDSVEVYASLDGIGKVAEYIRSGTDWNRIEQNLIKLTKSNIPYSIAATVQLFNIGHMPEFFNRLIELNINLKDVGLTDLVGAHQLRANLLPDYIKEKYKKKFQEHIASITDPVHLGHLNKLYKQLVHYLDLPSDNKTTVIQWLINDTERLDKLRNESIHDAIPELSAWYRSQYLLEKRRNFIPIVQHNA